MKKSKLLLPAAVFLSLIIQASFAYYFDKSSALDSFLRLCAPIKALASKSLSLASSAHGFTAGTSTLIIEMPSLHPNGLPSDISKDYCAAYISGRKLVISCYPAVSSARTAETLSFDAPKSLVFSATGNTLFFMAGFGRNFHAMDFEVARNYYIIPENKRWF